MCRKNYKILFYVTNVFFDDGECGECMKTFLGSYRLEKPPNFALYLPESITIGISIQIGHLLPLVIPASFCSCQRAARKMISWQEFLVSEHALWRAV